MAKANVKKARFGKEFLVVNSRGWPIEMPAKECLDIMTRQASSATPLEDATAWVKRALQEAYQKGLKEGGERGNYDYGEPWGGWDCR